MTAHWQGEYADVGTQTGDIRGDAPAVCPDHVTTSRLLYFYPMTTYSTRCQTIGKTTSCSEYPMTVMIPMYEYTNHALIDKTCSVRAVPQ